MDRCHHQLSGLEFEQIPVDGDGQGSLVYCSPWDSKQSDMTQQLNDNKAYIWASQVALVVKAFRNVFPYVKWNRGTQDGHFDWNREQMMCTQLNWIDFPFY